jgi:hypothetical protein
MTFAKPLFLALGVLSAGIAQVAACDQTIILSNWSSCAIAPLGNSKGATWDTVPTWTNSSDLRPYFFDDPRLLAEHGLCNAKFKRVVLCLPGWQESHDKDACWYSICSGYEASRK